MPEHRLLYLSRADVEAVGVTMPEIIDALAEAFHLHGEGKVEMPPKPGVHSRPNAFIHAMPCYIPGPEAIGVLMHESEGQGSPLPRKSCDPS